ncbi:hypothetical protein ACF0H5_005066 [Mactra antiquata]
MRPVIYAVIGALLTTSGFAETYVATEKDATAYCRYVNEDENDIRINFRLKLGGDPNIRLSALNQAEYFSANNFESVTCDVDYKSDGRVYRVENVIDKSGGNDDANLCGMQPITKPGTTWAYRVVYLHQTDHLDLIAGKDRVYVVECDSNTITDSFVTTNVSVLHPDAEHVNINNRKPELSLWQEKFPGSFERVGDNDIVNVRTRVLFQLEYNYESQNTATYYGATGFRTIDSRLPNFANPIVLLDSQGCEEDQLAAGIGGFKKYDDGLSMPSGLRVFRTRTDAFQIWAWGTAGSQLHYFRVYYDLCHIRYGINSDSKCEDTCLYSQQLNGRRRRDIEERYNSTTLRIQVYDPDFVGDNNGLSGSETNMGLMIGAIVGAIVLCALFVLILVLLVCRRRRSSTGRKEKIAPRYFENEGQTKY